MQKQVASLIFQDNLTYSRVSRSGLFKRWTFEGDQGQVPSEVRLWRAVLDRALIDSLSYDRELKKDVKDWLKKDNPDFRYCCEAADLKPELVMHIFKEVNKALKGAI